jgi:hypothetical protein
MKKKAAIGEGIINIFRIILIALIALVILGSSAVIFDYYINVRSLEAQILASQVTRCLAPNGVFDASKIEKQAGDMKVDVNYNLLDYCGIENKKRFYVSAYISWIVPEGVDSELDKYREEVRNKWQKKFDVEGSTPETYDEMRTEEDKLSSRTYQEGDSGMGWIRDIKDVMWLVDEVNGGREITAADVPLFKDRWGKYFPGVRNPNSMNYPSVYSVIAADKGKMFRGRIAVEVIVDHEF